MRGVRVGIKPNTPEWLAWRAQGITATDTAAILGLSTYNSAFNLFWQKTQDRATMAAGGQLAERARSARFQFGHDAEPLLHRAFARDVLPDGWRIGSGGCWQGRLTRDWLRATPDRVLYTDRRTRTPAAVLEFKTDNSDGFGEDDGSGVPVIPVGYRVQLLHQMIVVGVEVGWLTVLTSRFDIRHYRVTPQPGEVELILEAAWAFDRQLIAGEAPDVDGHDTTTDRLKAMYGDQDGTDVDVDEDLAERFLAANAARKAAEAEEAEAKNLLLAAMGNAKRAMAGGRRIATRSVSCTDKFSQTALKEDDPETYAKYLRPRTEIRLTAARPPKPETGTPITEETS